MNRSRDKNEIMEIRRSVISSDSLLIFSISNLICKIWNEISNSFLWTRFYILSVNEIISNYCYSFCNPRLQKMKHSLLFLSRTADSLEEAKRWKLQILFWSLQINFEMHKINKESILMTDILFRFKTWISPLRK